MNWLLLVILALSFLPSCSNAAPLPKYTSGMHTITVDGVLLQKEGGGVRNFSKTTTALATATGESFKCNSECEVVVIPGSIHVTITGLDPSLPDTTPSATVTWSPPTSRKNGDVLADSEIEGYEILVSIDGTHSARYIVNTPGMEHISKFTLTDGVYGFKIRTIDTNGLSSDFSRSAFKTVGG